MVTLTQLPLFPEISVPPQDLDPRGMPAPRTYPQFDTGIPHHIPMNIDFIGYRSSYLLEDSQ